MDVLPECRWAGMRRLGGGIMVAPDVMQPRTVASPCKCRAHLFRKGIRKMMISANVARNENVLAKEKNDCGG